MFSKIKQNLFWLFKIVVFFTVSLILQLVLLPNISVLGVFPDPCLTLVILISLLYGSEAGLPLALFSILVLRNYLHEPALLFSWLLTPFLANSLKPSIRLEEDQIKIIQVGLCSFIVRAIDIFTNHIEHNFTFVNIYDLANLCLYPLFNCLIAFPLLVLLKKAFSLPTESTTQFS